MTQERPEARQEGQQQQAEASATQGRRERQQGRPQEGQQDSEQERQGARGDRQRGIQTTRETTRETSREQGRGEGRGEVGTAQRGAGMTRRPQGGTQGVSRGLGQGVTDPLFMMQRMAEDMDRLFEQFGLGRAGRGLSPLSLGSPFALLADRDPFGMPQLGNAYPARGGRDQLQQAAWNPQVEAFRRGDKLVVRADVPGVSKDDLHVEVQDGLLLLSGERREEDEESRDDYYRSERRYGRFSRAIVLPEGVDEEECEATFRDGVLEVTLPVTEEERRPRRIQVR